MIVTLNSDNPNDALLIERLFAPAERTGCCGDRQMELELPAVSPSNAEVVAAIAAPLPDFIIPEQPVIPPAPPAAEPPSVDSNGLPWDARIHSESKATVADGSWRKRRGVDPELAKQVEAELRGTPASIPAPPPPVAEIPPPPPVVAPEPAAPAGKTLADLSAAVAQGKVDILKLIELAKQHGCQDIPALSNNPQALAAVIAHFDGLGVL